MKDFVEDCVHLFGIGSKPALGNYVYTISGINFEHPKPMTLRCSNNSALIYIFGGERFVMDAVLSLCLNATTAEISGE